MQKAIVHRINHIPGFPESKTCLDCGQINTYSGFCAWINLWICIHRKTRCKRPEQSLFPMWLVKYYCLQGARMCTVEVLAEYYKKHVDELFNLKARQRTRRVILGTILTTAKIRMTLERGTNSVVVQTYTSVHGVRLGDFTSLSVLERSIIVPSKKTSQEEVRA